MKRDSGVGGPTAGTAAPPKTNGGRRKNGASAAATGEQVCFSLGVFLAVVSFSVSRREGHVTDRDWWERVRL